MQKRENKPAEPKLSPNIFGREFLSFFVRNYWGGRLATCSKKKDRVLKKSPLALERRDACVEGGSGSVGGVFRKAWRGYGFLQCELLRLDFAFFFQYHGKLILSTSGLARDFLALMALAV